MPFLYLLFTPPCSLTYSPLYSLEGQIPCQQSAFCVYLLLKEIIQFFLLFNVLRDCVYLQYGLFNFCDSVNSSFKYVTISKPINRSIIFLHGTLNL